MPALLDYLVSQVVCVPDHILDTFKFSKYLGLALDPAFTLYPLKFKEYQAYPKHIRTLATPKTFSKSEH